MGWFKKEIRTLRGHQGAAVSHLRGRGRGLQQARHRQRDARRRRNRARRSSGARSTAPSGSTATTTRSSASTRSPSSTTPRGCTSRSRSASSSSTRAKWDALPADLKEIVKVSVQASYWNHFVRFQEKTAKACQELLASGIKIIKTTDELNKGFLKAYDEVVAGGRGQGRLLQEGHRLAEEVLRPAGAVPPLVLAELQLHRGALLQGQDLAEVADR